MLKIQVAQINPTVCDLQGNVRLMIDAAVAACTAQAQLVVFPDLSHSLYAESMHTVSFISRPRSSIAKSGLKRSFPSN